jgi:hypothetical protein
MILGLGVFCQELLGSEAFDAITKLYSQQCAVDILNTPPKEKEARENIYAAYQGFEGFLALVRKFADAHEKLTNQNTAAQDTTDDIDDPRVHDIYDGMN